MSENNSTTETYEKKEGQYSQISINGCRVIIINDAEVKKSSDEFLEALELIKLDIQNSNGMNGVYIIHL